MVYGAKVTPLVSSTRSLGCIAVGGKDVLLAQAVRQFEMMTGKEMPITLARETLGMKCGWGMPVALRA
jgi:shikimate 5-dehydrogenase